MKTVTAKGRLGQQTKGLTCENRLRQIDTFICIQYNGLIQRKDAIFVDVGFGKYPTTTLETHRRLKALNSVIKTIGTEINTERYLYAKNYEQANAEFRLGGFNLPLHRDEKASIIRCYNVLRQYPEDEFLAAIENMGRYLVNGGIIIEGTSDQFGRLISFNLFEKLDNRICNLGLVFGTNFRSPFYPRDFQSVLPRNLIQRMITGEWIYQFFDDWNSSFYKVINKFAGMRQIFYETAIILHKEYKYPVMIAKRLLRKGFLVVGNIEKHI